MIAKNITWTKVKLARFKKVYITALEQNKTSFKFEGNLFDTKYAKYLIEYLESIRL